MTNEISEAFERALDISGELGIREIERNSLWEKSVTELSAEEAARAHAMVRERGLWTRMILAPTFKSLEIDAVAPGAEPSPVFRRHLQTFDRSIAMAHVFRTDQVRVFSFARPSAVGPAKPLHRSPTGGPLSDQLVQRIADGLRPLEQIAEREGITLCLENVRSCYADSGANARRILDAIGSPSFRLIWDPANAFVSGEEAAGDAYRRVRSYVADVHLKDARVVDRMSGATASARIGDGEVGLFRQIMVLLRQGYAGTVTIETHWHRTGDQGEQSTRETYAGLLLELDQALEQASAARDR